MPDERIGEMTAELWTLLASVALGFVHIVAASHAASLQRGYKWTAGARDEALPPLAGVAGRLDRASRNFLETFPLFAAVVLIVHIADERSSLSIWGAQLYFWSRVAYLPLYVAGVWLVRSLVWNLAFAGIVLTALALL